MPHGVPETFEQPQRVGVLGEHERGEPLDSLLVRAFDQTFEQCPAQAAVLPVVGDDDRALGDVVADAYEAGHADRVVRVRRERHQRLVVVMVDRGQV